MDNLYSYIFNLTLNAGKILRDNFNKTYDYSMKNQREIVTSIDTEIEEYFYKNIKKEYKTMEFLAEEKHISKVDFMDTIILDPIDGTNNFFYHLPFVAISIAYYHEKMGQFGIVFNPILEEMFVGMHNEGAYLNGKKINVSRTSKIENALLATGLPYDRNNENNNNLNNIKKIGSICRDIRRFGSAALDICYVAKGTFDGYWELQLKPWDVAAAAIIVKEAGGIITNFNNEVLSLTRNDFLASNGIIHKKMQKILTEEVI